MRAKLRKLFGTLLSWAVLLPLGLAGSFGETGAPGSGRLQDQSAGAAPPAVLVELFTSEGCSTCPPADRLLRELEQNQPIKGVQVIALSEHVDYWNRLGWKDRFSSAEFTSRQGDYARALGQEDIYTPQMIVDGRTAFVGSNRAAAIEAITNAARATKARIRISVASSAPDSITLAVDVEDVPAARSREKTDVMLAITENGLESKVTRGENKGRELAHSAVARKLIKMGTVEGKTLDAQQTVRLDPLWKRQHMKAVAFVQERASRRVLGAAQISLSPELSQ